MAVDETELFLGSGKRLIFQIEFLTVHHASAACTCAQRLCRVDTDRSGSRRTGDCLESLGQQDVTGQHRGGFTECLVAGGLAAAHIVVIHAGQVIMDERIAVQHLDCGCKLLSCLGIAVEHITHGQHQHSANALAAAQQAVARCAADVRFLRQIALTRLAQCLFCTGQIFVILLFILCALHNGSSLQTVCFYSSVSGPAFSLREASISSI